MRLLKSSTLAGANLDGTILHRKATRAIVLRGDKILLLYTQRYHDYTLPGGGVDDNESLTDGLIRELREETGADNVTNIVPFGCYEEFRPWHRDGADTLHMESYCYTCDIDDELGQTQLEDYEINNGMKPVWLPIKQAITHNLQTMATSEKQGLSIMRETFLLQTIAKELVTTVIS